MKYFRIYGGRKLDGSVKISGSKNCSLPILFSLLMTDGTSVLENLPSIGDVNKTLDILQSMGVRVNLSKGKGEFSVEKLSPRNLDRNTVSQMRASTYLLGSMLSRFGEVEIMEFGGCNFCTRPIDMHLNVAKLMGAKQIGNTLYCDKLKGNRIIFEKKSVGATVNAILMASSADGESEIAGFAEEPHIFALIDFLKSCGAEIDYSKKERKLSISGRKLHGGKIVIPKDTVECATYMALSLMTESPFEILGDFAEDLKPFLEVLKQSGVELVSTPKGIRVFSEIKAPINIKTAPHPAFPTDLQPIMAPLLAKYCGGIIEETVFPKRFGYLKNLEKFGIEYYNCGNKAEIFKSQLHNGIGEITDLRGGASLILTALSCENESKIYNPEIFLRGYESPIRKLKLIGAEIEYIDE